MDFNTNNHYVSENFSIVEDKNNKQLSLEYVYTIMKHCFANNLFTIKYKIVCFL